MAGFPLAVEVFRQVDPGVRVELLAADGDRVDPGSDVLAVSGRVRSLVAAERTALNYLQRLAGIATLTRRYVEAVAGTGATILDTRKTIPGWRALDKYAVRCGGGANHRMGLFDAAMVKDNHLACGLGGPALGDAIRRLKAAHPTAWVELEADRLDQVRAFLDVEGVDRILLDNMPPATLCEAVALVAGRIPLEASGGVNLDTVRAIAGTGVDFISVGAITHSAPALDLALDFR
jgi:nicotinate-nucleotide pyrophosphorylase (carboxylating)